MKQVRQFAAVVAIGLGAGSLLAAERATFVLTDGERVSGEVVFHTEARTNIRADKNEFNLKLNNGIEMPIPFDHVVLIDFVGGQPRSDELAALPSDGHLLTLRNGDTRTGRLVDMIGGTQVRWRSGGRENDIAITDVRRIFLRPDRVREIYNVPATSGGAAQPAPAPVTPAPPTRGGRQSANTTTITVRGAVDWVDTGLTVKRGQSLQFQASGQVYYARDNGAFSGPEGKGAAASQFPVPQLPVGALIGKVGVNGTPFAIGNTTNGIAMPATGRLFLGVNDDQFDDNSGSFRVVVAR